MPTNRYDTLDGWRGLAALAIAFYHLPVAHAFRDLAGWKNLEFFVDFFFVLSGFVICHAWGKRLTTAQDGWVFMQRRFWRVWPLHIVILALSCCWRARNGWPCKRMRALALTRPLLVRPPCPLCSRTS